MSLWQWNKFIVLPLMSLLTLILEEIKIAEDEWGEFFLLLTSRYVMTFDRVRETATSLRDRLPIDANLANTAKCKRGFSEQNRIKTTLKNSF
jgi:hypothetical protein